MAGFAILNKPRLEKALENGNVAADGLYSWEEYEFLKKEFGDKITVVAVYSSPKTRYARLKHRPVRPLNFEEASSRDKSEIEISHKAGPIAMADYTIVNEGNLEEMKQSLKKILGRIP